jgi:peptide deformylase
MKIIIYPNNILSTPAKVVETIDDSLQNLIDNMLEVMADNNGLGLAANQVGESKRLFVFHKSLVLINPAIEKIGDSVVIQEEVCLSLVGLQVHIARASKIMVTSLNRDGSKQRFEADGMLARIIQHETDHLNGVLLIDHASRQIRRAYSRKIQKMIGKRRQ